MTPHSPYHEGVTFIEETTVFYDPSDIISVAMAWISLTPLILLIIYATMAISRREVETFLMGAGQVVCELANHYVKNQIKQDRPRYGPGYGMPSAHAQFVFYYASYLILWMCFRVHFSTRKRILRSLGLILMASVVAYSRAYLFYHTELQVAAGCIMGIAIGAGWFVVVCILRDLGIVDLLLDFYPARWFYIKDTACEKTSFVREEYVEWRRVHSKMKLLVKMD